MYAYAYNYYQDNKHGGNEMKRNFWKEVEDMIAVAEMVGRTELVIRKDSANAGVSYPSVEMVRGDFDTIRLWCKVHRNDPEFLDGYTSSYHVGLAK
jgi:hypothetical protein